MTAMKHLNEGPADSVGTAEHLGVRIDRRRYRVYAKGRPVDLTRTEFRLLECLALQPGRAFTRSQLMDAAKGDGAGVGERTVDAHIKALRRKLGRTDLIEAVYGVGYRFRETEGAG